MTRQLPVKCVKNSTFIEENNGDLVALHYNSEIVRLQKNVAGVFAVINLYVPSVTSSKMAKRCIEFAKGAPLEDKEWHILKERFNQ